MNERAKRANGAVINALISLEQFHPNVFSFSDGGLIWSTDGSMLASWGTPLYGNSGDPCVYAFIAKADVVESFWARAPCDSFVTYYICELDNPEA